MSGELPSGVIQFNNGTQSQFDNRVPALPIHTMSQLNPNSRAVAGIPLGVSRSNMGSGNQQAMSTNISPTFPPPPSYAIPEDLRSRQRVRLSDIRDERLTEADAFERLCSFVVLRLERANTGDDVDGLSYPTRSKWETVYQIEQSGISKQVAARCVASLDRETGPVFQKKAALSTTIQRQLEAAGEELARTERDPRYQYILVQLSSQERKVEAHQLEHGLKHKRGRKDSKHGKKDKSKPKYERVAITAYFKRRPISGQNYKLMLEDRERERQREQQMSYSSSLPLTVHQMPVQVPTQMPAHFPSIAQPMGGAPYAPVMPVNPVAQPMAKQNSREKPNKPFQQDQDKPGKKDGQDRALRPGIAGVQKSPSSQGKPQKQAVPVQSKEKKQDKPIAQKRETPVEMVSHGKRAQGYHGQGKAAPVEIVPSGMRSQGYHGSPKSSRSSIYSEESFTTNESDFNTPQSSIGSSSHSLKHDRGRTLVRHQDQGQPEHFGIDPLRQHVREEPHHVVDRYPARRSLSPTLPYPVNLSPSRDSDPLRQDRRPHYSDDERLWRQRAPSPRIFQGSVRRVAAPQIRNDSLSHVGSRQERPRFQDDTKRERRLRFEDEDEFDRISEDIRQRRALKERLRGRELDNSATLAQEDRWAELDARSYMLNRERPLGIEPSRPISSSIRREAPRDYYVSR